MVTFSHKLMAYFFLLAGLSADMGVYRNSTMIRGRFILFYSSQKEEGMPCLGYPSIDGDIYFVRSSFRHYKVLLDGKLKEIDFYFTEQALSQVTIIQKGVR